MGGGVGGVESRIRLISAETAAVALLGLAELGHIPFEVLFTRL